MKTTRLLPIVLCLLASFALFSQDTINFQMPTSINLDGLPPDGSAILDVQATDKGMLVPRMTTAQRTAIASPATGLLVYDTGFGTYWFYEYGVWNEIATAAPAFVASGTNSNVTPIPDDHPGIPSTISLTQVSTIKTTTQIKVCMDITHTAVSNLSISLEGPDGTTIDLSSGNGGTGDNYSQTCFTTFATDPITGGSAPFTGNWMPEQPFSNFVSKPIGGDWKLTVTDDAPGDEGQLNFWSLEISPGFTFPNMLSDLDRDTKVQVEKTADEDRIRFDVGGMEAMRIDTSGKVGIGASAPTTQLHVKGDGEILTLENATANSSGDGPTLVFKGKNTFNQSILSRIGMVPEDAGNPHRNGALEIRPADRLNIYRGNAIASNNIGLTLLASNGNIGIGTTTPNTKFTIAPLSKDAKITLYDNGSTTDHYGFGVTTNQLNYHVSETAASHVFFAGGKNGDGTELMRIRGNGKVGIGMNPVTNMLEVNGNASKTTAGDWLANSDARLKTNIRPLDSEEILQKMLALRGITYEWADDVTGSERPEGTMYGFTAQNIREVFPELVTEDNLGYLQTAYGTYDAMTVEAIRALYQEIENGKRRMEHLEAENRTLQAQLSEMDALKTRMAKIEALLSQPARAEAQTADE